MQNETQTVPSPWVSLSVYLALTAIAVLVNWPGRASPDSIDMLYQATHLTSLTSWHSPVVSLFYSLLGPAFGFPGGALVLQSCLMMTWPALLLSDALTMQCRWYIQSLAVLLGLLLACLLIAFAGQVVKDLFIVSLMSVAFSILLRRPLYSLGSLSPAGLIAVFGILFVFLLVRSTNVFVVLFSAAAVLLAEPGRWRPARIFKIAGALVAVIVLAAGAMATGKTLLPTKTAQPELGLILFDMAGISARSGSDLFAGLPDWTPPPKLRPWECYNAFQGDPFLWGDCSEYGARAQAQPPGSLLRPWIEAIAAHPLSYLQHRALFTWHLLVRSGRGTDFVVPAPPTFDLSTNAPVHVERMPPEMRVGLQLWRPTVAYLPFGVLAWNFTVSPFGQPWCWLLVVIAGTLYGAGLYRSEHDARLVLGASFGLGNALMLMVFAPSDDLRYLLPTMMSAFAVVCLILQRLSKRIPGGMSPNDKLLHLSDAETATTNPIR